MASPKTLELRKWRLESDRRLLGNFIHIHPIGVPGIPYRKKFTYKDMPGTR